MVTGTWQIVMFQGISGHLPRVDLHPNFNSISDKTNQNYAKNLHAQLALVKAHPPARKGAGGESGNLQWNKLPQINMKHYPKKVI